MPRGRRKSRRGRLYSANAWLEGTMMDEGWLAGSALVTGVRQVWSFPPLVSHPTVGSMGVTKDSPLDPEVAA